MNTKACEWRRSTAPPDLDTNCCVLERSPGRDMLHVRLGAVDAVVACGVCWPRKPACRRLSKVLMAAQSFDASALLREELTRHEQAAAATYSAVAGSFARIVDLAVSSLLGGGKLILFGNGGSAADAQHWAAELTVRFRSNRRAIAALALTTDSSAITAIGNDFGFEHIFARQIEALAKRGDVAIGISTSGRSTNVVNALVAARTIGCRTVAFTGSGGAAIADLVDVLLMVPSTDTASIQEMNLVLVHAFCVAIEEKLSNPGP